MKTRQLSVRLARWIDRYRVAILSTAVVLMVGAGVYASRLPVHGDFSYLLPESAPSVVHLRQLEKRVTNIGTLLVLVDADHPVTRARAAEEMRQRLEQLDKNLVSTIIFDDRVARQFIWDHRFLYADLKDLKTARDALAAEIEQAKLEANPLYIDFEDEGDEGAAGQEGGAAKTGAELEAKLADAEAKKDQVGRVSKDGRLQLIIVRTSFEAGTASKGRQLVAQVERAAAEIEREHQGVTVALTGDVVVALSEHDALLSGMLKAALVTVLIVAAGLMAFYRSVRGIAAIFFSLGLGVAFTFAFTRVAIGHLNMASAFLSSIVIGNGVNFGILLLARHLEERRKGVRGVEAIATAMRGTFTGTLAAALTATVAYGSLAATSFRGFKHFGIIAGAGMLFCWIAAYTVLPAALAVLERRNLRVRRTPGLGAFLVRFVPSTHGGVATVAAIGMGLTLLAGVATWHYLQNPYEDDFRNLRSSTDRIEAANAWSARIDAAFGRHLSGGFVVAATDREAARKIAATLRAVSDDSGHPRPLTRQVRTLDDLLPKDQAEKLTLLGELRAMIDREADRLSPEDRARLVKLRPPDILQPVTDGDLPPEMAGPFTERDGRRGLILYATNSQRLDTWVAHELLEMTAGVTSLELPPGTALGGANFVFADVVRSMQADGPRATLIALGGAVLVILTLIGLGRHGAVTLVCMTSGVLLMLAGAWIVGLRVNFLDFVALPITIGIGIDYAVNIVARARQGRDEGRVGAARDALATTGGAVAMCSFTTIVGYGSLLLSANKGIHSFGMAAMLGELTCIAAALLLAPTLLQLVAPRRGGPEITHLDEVLDEAAEEPQPVRREQAR